MKKQKSFITKFFELVAQHRNERWEGHVPTRSSRMRRTLHWLTPNGGTILLVLILIFTQNVWAAPLQSALHAPGPSATTINYQGRLASSEGTPLDEPVDLKFAIYDALDDGNMIWPANGNPELHEDVNVSDGLFSVGLGNHTNGGIPASAWNGDRWLQVWVEGEKLNPREQIHSVPIAGMALTAQTADVASTVSDGATAQGSLTIGENLYVNNVGHFGNGQLRLWNWQSNNTAIDGLLSGSTFGSIIEGAVNGHHVFGLRENDGGDGFAFLTGGGNYESDSTYDTIAMFIKGNGDVTIAGTLISGAYVESNLLTSEQREMEVIENFTEGDLLCWSPDDQKLELCANPNARLIVAVADDGGKPIIMGAEPIKVLGPVQAGDLLVSSNIPGYAMVNNNPLPGTVIAQALEDFNGERGLIKAMIRKW